MRALSSFSTSIKKASIFRSILFKFTQHHYYFIHIVYSRIYCQMKLYECALWLCNCDEFSLFIFPFLLSWIVNTIHNKSICWKNLSRMSVNCANNIHNVFLAHFHQINWSILKSYVSVHYVNFWKTLRITVWVR